MTHSTYTGKDTCILIRIKQVHKKNPSTHAHGFVHTHIRKRMFMHAPHSWQRPPLSHIA